VLRYLIKRMLLATLTLFAVSVLSFLMFFSLPRDPVTAMCGKACDPERIARVKAELGLDRPIPAQYADYMKGVFVGRQLGEAEGGQFCDAPCLGFSYVENEMVIDRLLRVLPVTLSIVMPAAVLWLAMGVGLGMVSALRRGTVFDKAAITTSLAGASMQVYFFGPILLLIFVYTTGLLDYPSYTPIAENPLKWASGLVLPWFTLAFLNSAIYARLSRAQMLETLSEDFVRTARAKGLPLRRVYGKHALRAALTPIVTIAGLDIGSALGGTVITETVFGLQGLGRTAVDAVSQGDLPILMAVVLLAAFFVVLANIVVDFLYTMIDPRVRLS
jgi:peptide/nickel transport system permease protein